MPSALGNVVTMRRFDIQMTEIQLFHGDFLNFTHLNWFTNYATQDGCGGNLRLAPLEALS